MAQPSYLSNRSRVLPLTECLLPDRSHVWGAPQLGQGASPALINPSHHTRIKQAILTGYGENPLQATKNLSAQFKSELFLQSAVARAIGRHGAHRLNLRDRRSLYPYIVDSETRMFSFNRNVNDLKDAVSLLWDTNWLLVAYTTR
jgi:hypothetical protein